MPGIEYRFGRSRQLKPKTESSNATPERPQKPIAVLINEYLARRERNSAVRFRLTLDKQQAENRGFDPNEEFGFLPVEDPTGTRVWGILYDATGGKHGEIQVDFSQLQPPVLSAVDREGDQVESQPLPEPSEPLPEGASPIIERFRVSIDGLRDTLPREIQSLFDYMMCETSDEFGRRHAPSATRDARFEDLMRYIPDEYKPRRQVSTRVEMVTYICMAAALSPDYRTTVINPVFGNEYAVKNLAQPFAEGNIRTINREVQKYTAVAEQLKRDPLFKNIAGLLAELLADPQSYFTSTSPVPESLRILLTTEPIKNRYLALPKVYIPNGYEAGIEPTQDGGPKRALRQLAFESEIEHLTLGLLADFNPQQLFVLLEGMIRSTRIANKGSIRMEGHDLIEATKEDCRQIMLETQEAEGGFIRGTEVKFNVDLDAAIERCSATLEKGPLTLREKETLRINLAHILSAVEHIVLHLSEADLNSIHPDHMSAVRVPEASIGTSEFRGAIDRLVDRYFALGDVFAQHYQLTDYSAFLHLPPQFLDAIGREVALLASDHRENPVFATSMVLDHGSVQQRLAKALQIGPELLGSTTTVATAEANQALDRSLTAGGNAEVQVIISHGRATGVNRRDRSDLAEAGFKDLSKVGADGVLVSTVKLDEDIGPLTTEHTYTGDELAGTLEKVQAEALLAGHQATAVAILSACESTGLAKQFIREHNVEAAIATSGKVLTSVMESYLTTFGMLYSLFRKHYTGGQPQGWARMAHEHTVRSLVKRAREVAAASEEVTPAQQDWAKYLLDPNSGINLLEFI